MDPAPLSQRSNFEGILSRSCGPVNTIPGKGGKICIFCGGFFLGNAALLWYNNRDLRILFSRGGAAACRQEEDERGEESMELAILDWVQANLRCGFLDAVLPVITRLSDHGEIWILLAAVLLVTKKVPLGGRLRGPALILDLTVCNGILKPLVDRVRPYAVNTAVELLVAAPGDASFPSGHTAASFTAVTALWLAGGVPKWLRWGGPWPWAGWVIARVPGPSIL